MANNKYRLLSLIKILSKESDKNHPLKEIEIKASLSKDGIDIKKRHTIYEDIAVLNDFGYEVIYDTKTKGYYLDSSPFKLAEIKILLDEINSLKDFDNTKLKNKLLSFISIYEEKQIKDNEIIIKTSKKNNTYENIIESILDSINNHRILKIEYNKTQRIIRPYFLYFSNGKYYLYLKLIDNDTIYSYRLDRITKLIKTDDSFSEDGSTIEEIKKRIKTSINVFDKNKPELIILESKEYETLSNRLEDDFPNHFLDNHNDIVIEYRPNEIFFSKLVSYGDKLKIKAPLSVKETYIEYLTKIIKIYKH